MPEKGTMSMSSKSPEERTASGPFGGGDEAPQPLHELLVESRRQEALRTPSGPAS